MRVQPGEKNLPAMQPIHVAEDAGIFADRIVAFQGRGYIKPYAPFLLESSGGLCFAYVKDYGDGRVFSGDLPKYLLSSRYSLSRLHDINSTPFPCWLSDDLEHSTNVQMRLATDSEIIAIAKAVDSGQAKFEARECIERTNEIFKNVLNSSDRS